MAQKLFDKTVLKFLIVGIFNTLVGCGIMFLLYNLAGCSYWFSSAANYVIGSIVSFFLNKYFTFQKKEWSWKQVGKFALNVAVCYFLAYGAAKPLVLYLLSGQAIQVQESGNVFVYWIELSGTEIFCISEIRRDCKNE